MKTIKTWSNRDTYFEYEGSVETGTKIYYGTDFAFKSVVSKKQYQVLIDKFQGRTVLMGASQTSPQPDSVGDWLRINIKGPGIGSYVGSILVSEGYASKDGSKIIFNAEKITKDRNESLKFELAKLAKLQIKLEEKGGPTEDGDLFEETIHIEDKILKSFGLPEGFEYGYLISFEVIPSELEILNRIEELHKAAEIYLLDDPLSDAQVLKNAQEFNQSAFIVLPEIKIKNHSYTHFVFDEILLKRKDTIENILHELKLTNNSAILNILGQVGTIDNQSLNEMIRDLRGINLKYLDRYIASTNFL